MKFEIALMKEKTCARLVAVCLVVAAQLIIGASYSHANTVWSGGMEGGTMQEWWAPCTTAGSCGNEGGGEFNSGGGLSQAVCGTGIPAHSGNCSAKLTIYAGGENGDSGARLFRWVEPRQNREAYYSAWFYFPTQPTIANWYQLFQFKSRSTSNQVDPFWYLVVTPSNTFQLTWWNQLTAEGPHQGESGYRTYGSPVTMPIGRWFQIETFLRQSNAFDGRITVWLDGQQIFDQTNVKTGYVNCSYNSWCVSNEWSVNSYGNSVLPSPLTMYVDDAAISTTRLSGAVDTQAPSVPTNLVATAVSSSRIDLSWAASADNVGVTGYDIYRNGAFLVSVASTTYQNTGLAPSTSYSYQVRARDAAGNMSALSSSASATTQSVSTSTSNLLSGKIAASSVSPVSGNVSMITNGDLNTNNYVDLGNGAQWIKFDLGALYSVNRVKLWHYYADGRTYRDVIVQLSNDPNFATGVATVFNNDTNNSAGQGTGSNAEYAETSTGKDITFAAVNARYVRFWSNGSTVNPASHYVEAEAYGSSTTTPPSQPTLKIGARVMTTAAVNVRNMPSTKKTVILGTQPSGSYGTITQGPQTGSGYTWWYVDFDSGADGWVVADYLAPQATAASVQTAAMASDSYSVDADGLSLIQSRLIDIVASLNRIMQMYQSS